MKSKIALEEHFLFEGFQQYTFGFVDTVELGDLERRLLDTEGERLDEMDRAGIEIAILSLTAPGIQAEPDARKAVDAAQRANDLLAEQVVDRSPDRFRGFAALPLQDAEAAADELERAVRRLRFCRRDGQWLFEHRRHEHRRLPRRGSLPLRVDAGGGRLVRRLRHQ